MLAQLDDDSLATVTPAVNALLRFCRAVTRPGAEVEAVNAARELATGADLVMRAGVSRARSAGRTWNEIGAGLHTSRQAAFQRFGRRETAMTPLEPHAGDRATAILTALAAGDFDTVRTDFDAQLTAGLDEAQLVGVWANITGTVGSFERLGEPFARQIGEHTVVDVPMAFEASDMIGRLAFDAVGKVAGLFVVRPEALG